jgi:plastocyanin
MRQVIWLGLVGVACMAAATACSGGSGGTGTGGDGGSGSPTSSSTTGASSSSGGSTLVNGCDPATAEDHLADAMVTITFPMGVNTIYTPACVKVKVGTQLVFNGDFASHPLNGGLDNMTDASSPIKLTNTGMTATFTLDKAGTFGWFCGFHGPVGMQGAAFVQ